MTRGVISVALDGVVRITAPQGYVRVTLIDADLRQYLIGEYYSLLTPGDTMALDGACRETCLLPGVIPHRLRIEVEGAALELDAVRIQVSPSSLPEDLAARREHPPA